MKTIISTIDDLVPLNKIQNISIFLIIVIIFQFAFFYTPALAKEKEISYVPQRIMTVKVESATPKFILQTIKIEKREFKKREIIISTSKHIITAYNSEPGQTDNTPCITANNYNVCQHDTEDTIAANFLKFGTKVKIPELFGDRIFIVRDRMNKKHSNRVDVWMKNKQDAIKFGVKYATIQIIK